MAFKDVKAGLKAAKDAVSKEEYRDVLRICEVKMFSSSSFKMQLAVICCESDLITFNRFRCRLFLTWTARATWPAYLRGWPI